MSLILFLLRPFYQLLYHQFAWTYDFVAAVVSLGQWQDWVRTALPYMDGRVLEIGFGPGHLQKSMIEKQFSSFGLDESPQMARQTSRRLCKQGDNSHLTLGHAQHLPFPIETFNTVVATFPSEYIFEPQTLKEIRRVLTTTGRLVILPMAWITGTRPLERMAAWLFRISGEMPDKPGAISPVISDQFSRLGFKACSEIVELKSSHVLVIVVEKGLGF